MPLLAACLLLASPPLCCCTLATRPPDPTHCLPCLQAAAARDPAGLAGLQPATFLLPALATGLQVPRALLAQEHMWTTGGWVMDGCAAG